MATSAFEACYWSIQNTLFIFILYKIFSDSCFIGSNSIIESNVVIGKNCVIGSFVTIKNSVI